MFNYKNWKLYSPIDRGGKDFPEPEPVPEEPSADPVVDENGNSITPDSLKKNMTIPAEAPGNDLEKVLSNINGADPAYSVESSSGLIKQMNELAENPPSGGGVPEANEEGLVLTTGTKGNKITIIDTHITTPTLHSEDDPYQGTWAGFDENLIKWPEDGDEYYIEGTVDGDDIEYYIKNGDDGHYIITRWGDNGHIKFFPDGVFKAWIAGKGLISDEALDSDFFLDIDKIESVWAPIPEGTVTATASANFVGQHTDSTLDMTADEIITALNKGPVFVQHYHDSLDGPIYQYGIVMRMDTGRGGNPYNFRVLTYYNGAPVEAVFTAASRADYPVCTGNTH